MERDQDPRIHTNRNITDDRNVRAEVKPQPKPTAMPSSSCTAARSTARRFAASDGSLTVVDLMPICDITAEAECSSP